MIDKESSAKGGSALTPAKLAALAAARSKRKQATEPIIAPEGWRSADHLLDDTREYVAKYGLTMALARYMGVTDGPVRRWLKREKMPRQDTLNAIARWRGARPGSGRKRLGKVKLLVSVQPRTASMLRQESRERKVPLGAVIDSQFP